MSSVLNSLHHFIRGSKAKGASTGRNRTSRATTGRNNTSRSAAGPTPKQTSATPKRQSSGLSPADENRAFKRNMNANSRVVQNGKPVPRGTAPKPAAKPAAKNKRGNAGVNMTDKQAKPGSYTSAKTARGVAASNARADRMAARGKAKAAANKPVKTVKTKGGNYPVYKKDSAPAKSFRSAFAAARKAGKKTFTWQGRKYSTKVK